MAETLLTKIKRSDNFPYVVPLSVTNNKGYISLNTEDWTPQMFYELPAIKFDIYTEQNGIMSRYNPVSYTLDTYSAQVDTNKICLPLKNIPENCYVYIYPIFDKTAIIARNALIENGIEDGDIWTSQTDTFNLELTYLEGVEQMKLILTAEKRTYDGDTAVGIAFTHSVPKIYTVTETGIQYSTNRGLGYTTGTDYAKVNLMDNPDYDVPELLKQKPPKIASYQNNDGRFVFNVVIGTNYDAYLYAIAYVKFTTNDNKQKTVYCNTCLAVTYNTIQ